MCGLHRGRKEASYPVLAHEKYTIHVHDCSSLSQSCCGDFLLFVLSQPQLPLPAPGILHDLEGGIDTEGGQSAERTLGKCITSFQSLFRQRIPNDELFRRVAALKGTLTNPDGLTLICGTVH